MQSRQVIDLLPDRKTETATMWMQGHPEIELVSRDRGGEYASAALAGAPQAQQVADRFHLLKNLRDALDVFLARHLTAKRQQKTQETVETSAPIWLSKRSPRLSPKLEHIQQTRREEREARYQQVIALHKQGLSQQAIAHRVGMGSSTVQVWLAAGTFPERKPREQGSHLDQYLPYLIRRWEQGCHNFVHLFHELKGQGYQGSYESIRDNMVRLLPEGRKFSPADEAQRKVPVLSRQAAFLFLRQPETLKDEEQETLLTVCGLNPEVRLSYEIVQQFTQMLRKRTGEMLDEWLTKVAESQIREL